VHPPVLEEAVGAVDGVDLGVARDQTDAGDDDGLGEPDGIKFVAT
jgi:hypothetical protein